jgi:hypothetical protein
LEKNGAALVAKAVEHAVASNELEPYIAGHVPIQHGCDSPELSAMNEI